MENAEKYYRPREAEMHEKAKKWHSWTACVQTPPSRQKKA